MLKQSPNYILQQCAAASTAARILAVATEVGMNVTGDTIIGNEAQWLEFQERMLNAEDNS